MINKMIMWISIITLMLVVFFIVIPLVPDNWIYPDEVINTFEACDWCKNNCSYCPPCIGGGTCTACVGYYRRYFNLSKETFPCYCWCSDESPPTKLEWFLRKFMEEESFTIGVIKNE